jgi:hypothetical protein
MAEPEPEREGGYVPWDVPMAVEAQKSLEAAGVDPAAELLSLTHTPTSERALTLRSDCGICSRCALKVVQKSRMSGGGKYKQVDGRPMGTIKTQCCRHSRNCYCAMLCFVVCVLVSAVVLLTTDTAIDVATELGDTTPDGSLADDKFSKHGMQNFLTTDDDALFCVKPVISGEHGCSFRCAISCWKSVRVSVALSFL